MPPLRRGERTNPRSIATFLARRCRLLALRRGESIIDSINSVEDTKGNNGDRGCLTITNLRIMWQSHRHARANLSASHQAQRRRRRRCGPVSAARSSAANIARAAAAPYTHRRHRLQRRTEPHNQDDADKSQDVSAGESSGGSVRAPPASRTPRHATTHSAVAPAPPHLQALYAMTKVGSSRYEFIFTSLVKASPKLFTTAQAVLR